MRRKRGSPILSRLVVIVLFLFLSNPLWPQAADGKKSQAPSTKPERYARMPEEAVPFRRFTKPYKEWFVEPNTLEYNGAASHRPDGSLDRLESVNIGFLGPLENNPESPYGAAMLRGAQLAIEEANARGGFHVTGKPYALKVHNDAALWGASSAEIVKMDFNEHVWALLGSIDGASTHIALRVTLKLEIPIVDTGTTDPTVTETRIQWLLHNLPDDRQQGYALAEYVFKQLGLKRFGVLRAQTRYARVGVAKFNDQARRMGHQPVLEVKFERGDQDFTRQLHMLRDAAIEALVIWGEASEAGLILKQMRALGMKQPVFGSSRLAYPQLLEIAGEAAEGLVTTCALDPTRPDPKWQEFRERYRRKFNQEPDGYASYAYDGMALLIAAIEKAGLNRGRIMEVLRDHQLKTYDGVSGRAVFDRTLNNIAPVTMAEVKDGKFVYWTAQRREPPGGEERAGNR